MLIQKSVDGNYRAIQGGMCEHGGTAMEAIEKMLYPERFAVSTELSMQDIERLTFEKNQEDAEQADRSELQEYYSDL